MSRRLPRVFCAAAALALAACGATSGAAPSASFTAQDEHATRVRGRQAIVVAGHDLDGRSTDLIGILRNRVAGLQVDNRGVCRTVTLRGQRSMFGDNTPLVYVDGTRSVDSCVLGMLNPGDVSRVEVYPQGVAPAGPYAPHANGVILVFMRTASS
jgi:TonB-dependent Receptor Plug Domain